eukprot:6211373-Pleurochrysis_carterae.AAC.1
MGREALSLIKQCPLPFWGDTFDRSAWILMSYTKLTTSSRFLVLGIRTPSTLLLRVRWWCSRFSGSGGPYVQGTM